MSEFKKMKLAEARAMFEANLDEKAINPYAVGMAAAKKAAHDEPPLKKSTIVKGHEIAKKIMNKEEAGETYDTTTHTPTAVKPLKKFKGKAPVQPVATHEEVEELEELSKATLGSYAQKAKDQMSRSDTIAGREMGSRYDGQRPSPNERKHNQRANKRHAGLTMAIDKLAKEEAEQIDELSRGTMKSYKKAASKDKSYHDDVAKSLEFNKSVDSSRAPNTRLDSAGLKQTNDRISYERQQSAKRSAGLAKVNSKLAKEEADMTDTSLSNIDASKTGEVYKKVKEKSTAPTTPTGTATKVVAGKDGEAYNTTGITKRIPAVESAVLDVIAQTMQKRKLFEDASNIAIISPEQRQDWLDVGTGKMDVVDYFNKYKV